MMWPMVFPWRSLQSAQGSIGLSGLLLKAWAQRLGRRVAIQPVQPVIERIRPENVQGNAGPAGMARLMPAVIKLGAIGYW